MKAAPGPVALQNSRAFPEGVWERQKPFLGFRSRDKTLEKTS
jgi:hypothetical protein